MTEHLGMPVLGNPASIPPLYRFMSLTGADEPQAKFCLEAADGDFQEAVVFFQEQVSRCGVSNAPPTEEELKLKQGGFDVRRTLSGWQITYTPSAEVLTFLENAVYTGMQVVGGLLMAGIALLFTENRR